MRFIGASLSEPHSREFNREFVTGRVTVHMSFCKCKLTLLTQNIAHAEFTGYMDIAISMYPVKG